MRMPGAIWAGLDELVHGSVTVKGRCSHSTRIVVCAFGRPIYRLMNCMGHELNGLINDQSNQPPSFVLFRAVQHGEGLIGQ